MKTLNQKNKDIAKDIGLHESEVSLALNGKRLLRREKLKMILDAGYDIMPFIFGKEGWESYRQVE